MKNKKKNKEGRRITDNIKSMKKMMMMMMMMMMRMRTTWLDIHVKMFVSFVCVFGDMLQSLSRLCAPNVRHLGRAVKCSTETIACSTRSECTTVAAIRLRMRMRILTRPESSLAYCSNQITTKSCELTVVKESASECEGFCK